jgi:hypothetical protein
MGFDEGMEVGGGKVGLSWRGRCLQTAVHSTGATAEYGTQFTYELSRTCFNEHGIYLRKSNALGNRAQTSSVELCNETRHLLGFIPLW